MKKAVIYEAQKVSSCTNLKIKAIFRKQVLTRHFYLFLKVERSHWRLIKINELKLNCNERSKKKYVEKRMLIFFSFFLQTQSSF